MNSLLPPNASELERKITQIGKAAFDLPSIRVTKDIDHVPSQFLPFIAWQKSVDYWDDNWQEELKRKVIKESRDLHQTSVINQKTYNLFDLKLISKII